MRNALLLFIALILLGSTILIAQGPPPPPLSQKELTDILKDKQRRAQAASIVEQRGVDFELNPDIEKQLRKAKADDQLIEAVKKAGPAARASSTTTTGEKISPEEAREIQTIQNELEPDRVLQLVTEFETKHPNSSMLTYAYTFAAMAYQQKGDLPHVLENGQKSLSLKKDNLLTLLVMSTMTAQPQNLKTGDADKKLSQAEDYANQALKLIEVLPKQPGETDEQYQTRKSQLSREPHSALGMVHLERSEQALEGPDKSELEKGEQEYTTATTVTSQPLASDFFRLGEVRERLKKYDVAIDAYKKAVETDQGTMIKGLAEERIAIIQKALGKPATQ